jgi:hypothetical protein
VRRKSIETISQFKYLFSLDKKEGTLFTFSFQIKSFLRPENGRHFFLFEVDNLLKG